MERPDKATSSGTDSPNNLDGDELAAAANELFSIDDPDEFLERTVALAAEANEMLDAHGHDCRSTQKKTRILFERNNETG